MTYENAQARERTQVLMDIANASVGWSSARATCPSWRSAGRPTTATICRCTESTRRCRKHWYGISSPTAPPRAHPRCARCSRTSSPRRSVPSCCRPKTATSARKPRIWSGPYELHDFFLYHFLRGGYPPAKLLAAAAQAFEGVYPSEVLLRWMETFFPPVFRAAVQTVVPAGRA